MSRGFGRLSAADRKRMASRGGMAAHASGRARRWTREQAAEAGRKGGQTRAERWRAARKAAEDEESV